MGEDLAQMRDGACRRERIEGIVGEVEFAGTEPDEEFVCLVATHPGVDALKSFCGREDLDQVFQSQVRGSSRLQQCGEVSPQDAVDAVAAAETFRLTAAPCAGQCRHNAGAVPADRLIRRVPARKHPVLVAVGALTVGVDCGGEANAADASIRPADPDLGDHSLASVALDVSARARPPLPWPFNRHRRGSGRERAGNSAATGSRHRRRRRGRVPWSGC